MTILITGGTGTLGTALTDAYLAAGDRVVVLSRGEHKQADLARHYPDVDCWIGDVRDRERVQWAMRVQPDLVIHAAALKRVEACEANPSEALKTHVEGTRIIVEEAMRVGVPRVIVVSSDKATSPETLYGKTKAMAEEVAIGQNAWRGSGPTRISVVRYGNVLGSQGSVLDVFARARMNGAPIGLTDRHATRFWWGIDDAAAFIQRTVTRMSGAEIWVPKLASAYVRDLAAAVAPQSEQYESGMRGHEKLHECMINATEARFAYDLPDCYVILPKRGYPWSPAPPTGAVPVPDGFTYASNHDPLPVRCEIPEVPVCGSP